MSDNSGLEEGAFGGSQDSSLSPEAEMEAFRRNMNTRFDVLTVLVVIWILSSYTERVSGG